MHYQDIDAAGALRPRCLHCDRFFSPDEATARERLRWFNAQAAAQLGYDIEGLELPDEPAGCGKPNCSQGRCKHGGKKHPFA